MTPILLEQNTNLARFLFVLAPTTSRGPQSIQVELCTMADGSVDAAFSFDGGTLPESVQHDAVTAALKAAGWTDKPLAWDQPYVQRWRRLLLDYPRLQQVAEVYRRAVQRGDNVAAKVQTELKL